MKRYQLEMQRAEQYLLDPSAANVEKAAAALDAVARDLRDQQVALRPDEGRVLQETLAAFKILLDAALGLRLGSARAALAGLHGYSPGGTIAASASDSASLTMA